MTASRPRRTSPIATWQGGDNVQGFALLRKKEVRQDKNGRDYLDLELADASGSISAKAWSDSAALGQSFAAGQFVAFSGAVQSYRDQLQLRVDNCRQARDADREHGFDEALLIPSTRYDLDELWQRLATALGRVERPVLRRLADETLAVHGAALRVHPAAKVIHHAYRGGLLEHVVSMAELAVVVGTHYRELDMDLVLVGVLFHDLGKLAELEPMPLADYTLTGRLVGHVVLGRDLLRERAAAIPDFPADLLLQLEHLVLSHQGRKEFSSPVEPMTAEALALHFIDDLDSKLAQLRDARANAHGIVYHRALGRFIYLGEDPAGAESPLAAGEAIGPDATPAGETAEDGERAQLPLL